MPSSVFHIVPRPGDVQVLSKRLTHGQDMYLVSAFDQCSGLNSLAQLLLMTCVKKAVLGGGSVVGRVGIALRASGGANNIDS